MGRQEATSTLAQAGFQPAFGDPIIGECKKDTVADQNPRGGRKADQHATITLRMCTGPGQTTVPVLQGLTRDNAQRALEQANLVAKFEEVDNEAPAGTVLSSNPAAGATVEKGTTVTVQVSKGNRVSVPNLIGLTRSQALARLNELNLIGQVVQGDQVDPSQADKVSSQNPKKDTKVLKGTTVKIAVDYAASPEPSESPSPQPSPTP
jgi:eukaryotic-like serine/threonine-protein kinase